MSTGVRRLPQFDANVLSLRARGVSVREIQAHLEQFAGSGRSRALGSGRPYALPTGALNLGRVEALIDEVNAVSQASSAEEEP